ncbi:hypothetical protein DYB25_007455 [Aphanomyces astaci]|uniref:Uncharacterized protein n=1 Tax=Aphanomyces astaci TaxID=112090 RepID=A0A397EZB0_APHAT|nr:hypothetical protein DYB36_005071 [Aphanomyces astaci]RHY25386.1 hypothetical protein DYB25_007455 [Aphanomyces astaci]RHY83361.1 hypothetical protein DYB26_010568 [Aphanomyces astaci]RHZ09278.1 hypothetical protein DYB31_001259 [Aphanomyces astaci]
MLRCRLNSTLSQSQAQWLFVVGQRPLCYRDRKGLYQNMHATLVPLFTAYQVDAYFGMDDLVSQVVHLPVGSSPFFTSYTYGAATSMPYMDMLASVFAIVYGLKFKGKRIDYRYNPCFKRQVAQAKVDTGKRVVDVSYCVTTCRPHENAVDGSGSRSTNDLPTDADDEEEEDEFDMDFSSDDEETSVVSGTTL